MSSIKQSAVRFLIGPGQTTRWGEKEWHAVKPLVERQDFIYSCDIVDKCPPEAFNFMNANDFIDREEFFEFDRNRSWPGDMNLRKFYFYAAAGKEMPLTARIAFFNSWVSWIHADKTKLVNVVAHIPKHRMCRSAEEWTSILLKLKMNGLIVKLIGGDDVMEWAGKKAIKDMIVKPKDMAEAADYINSARIFIGSASCNYVIAEALGVYRFVDVPDESIGTVPIDQKGWNVAKWSADRVVDAVMRIQRSLVEA